MNDSVVIKNPEILSGVLFAAFRGLVGGDNDARA